MPRKGHKQISIDNGKYYKTNTRPSDKVTPWIRNFTEKNEGFTHLSEVEKRWELPRGVRLIYSTQSEAHIQNLQQKQRRKRSFK